MNSFNVNVTKLENLPVDDPTAVITLKALHGSVPDYITELIKPRFNLLTYGGRSFTMAARSV